MRQQTAAWSAVDAEATCAPQLAENKTMNRSNLFFLVIGGLVVIAGVLGYQLYQDRKQPQGLEIQVGPKGISIENK